MNRSLLSAAGLICLLPLVTPCSGRGKDSAAKGDMTKTPAVSTTLTDAEVRYGVSPARSSQVTYQDDVIVMEHGAEAIRSQSANGMTWTIDANAPDARAIQPDKILFATGRVVGRVLAVENTGDGLAVTLGHITLTDVIKDAQNGIINGQAAASAPVFMSITDNLANSVRAPRSASTAWFSATVAN
jgi:hypothetical protein